MHNGPLPTVHKIKTIKFPHPYVQHGGFFCFFFVGEGLLRGGGVGLFFWLFFWGGGWEGGLGGGGGGGFLGVLGGEGFFLGGAGGGVFFFFWCCFGVFSLIDFFPLQKKILFFTF